MPATHSGPPLEHVAQVNGHHRRGRGDDDDHACTQGGRGAHLPARSTRRKGAKSNSGRVANEGQGCPDHNGGEHEGAAAAATCVQDPRAQRQQPEERGWLRWEQGVALTEAAARVTASTRRPPFRGAPTTATRRRYAWSGPVVIRLHPRSRPRQRYGGAERGGRRTTVGRRAPPMGGERALSLTRRRRRASVRTVEP